MTDTEQAAVFLKVRKEYITIQSELAAIKSSLRMFGEELLKAGKQLIDDPSCSLFDEETFCNSVRETRSKTNRYRELMENKEIKQKELAEYGETFAPLTP
jgi:DNA anti-recombination protein RmuC